MHPKLSVIVPVYKAEEYLHRCVDSILAQTFTDFELILVNDGSPDNSSSICEEYAQKDSRVKVIHKKNGGVSSARNMGIDNALGEWITFIDADDYVEQGFFNIPLSAKEDLLIQNYNIFGRINHTVDFVKSIIQPAQIQEFINKNIHELFLRVPWAKFFKRSIILENNIKFTEGVKIGEDTIFVLEYLKNIKSVQYLASSSYMYKSNEEKDELKYRLTPEKSVEIFNMFINRYERLNADSIYFLDFTFCYFYSLIHPREHKKETRIWYSDKCVKKIYRIIRNYKGFRWCLRYNLNKLRS